ncbi:MAG: glycosyltransferase [Candidatus Latescibacterota bacterium]
MRQLADLLLQSDADRFLWCLPPAGIADPTALRRLLTTADDTGAALAYGDFADEQPDGGVSPHPLIDYQPGSLCDDFDFGPFLAIGRPALAQVRPALEHSETTRHGGLYDLRRRLTEAGPVVPLSEPVARRPPRDPRPSGERGFDYVNPRNRDHQAEMEAVATAHLGRIGALVRRPSAPLEPEREPFPVTASVVIPVKKRARTVGDAVRSALAQQPPFAFNVVVVDNHSTDGTTEVLAEIAAKDRRLVHLVPARRDLGIGGCWNEAVFSPQCGRYAVQLDSDDLYHGMDVLERIVVVRWQERRGTALFFPRRAHRPAVFHAQGAARIAVSPAAIEMSGILVVPDALRFERLDARAARAVYEEVSPTPPQFAAFLEQMQ